MTSSPDRSDHLAGLLLADAPHDGASALLALSPAIPLRAPTRPRMQVAGLLALPAGPDETVH